MADMTFAEHVNIVANLDNSLSMSASLNRSGVALKVGSTYDVVSVLSVHNRATNQTEHTTISGTITSATIGAYLSLLESTIEAAYPIAVTTSTTSTVSQIATMNTVGVELTLSGSEHYIRALNMKISLTGVQQYDIDAELVNPLELTPSMLLFTPEALLAIDTVIDNIDAVETVVSNIADVNTVADNIANLNTVASIQNLANMTTVANDLNAMDLNGIADVTVVANNLVLGASSSINRVSTSIDNVNTVMSNITNIDAVAGIDNSVTEVALIDDSVVTVAGKIAAIETANANATSINTVSGSIDNVNSVATTIVPNIAEILEADTNAATATTKAAEALASANAADASELLAEKWATEAVDTVVLNGKYSSYHWATKANENVAPALSHAARTDNPHAVTAAQVGLGNVSNIAQVTAVSGTAPIVSSGGTTPVISISAATTSAPGSMSSADKTKLDGVAANANNYVHPATDGSLHVPATGTTNDGKVLTAGATAGSLSWATPAVTDLTVTAGTTAGPTINSSTGADVVIPSASGTNSGVVTTGAQTFAGVKTMTSPVLVTPSIGVATGTSFNSITGLATVAPVSPAVTAAVGTSTLTARQDHVHPTNFTATATDIKMNGTQSLGTLLTFPRADHVHPTDTSRAAAATSVQKDSNTGVAYLPAGTTAQRPVLANNTVGIRYNTETSSSEVGVGTAGATTWSPVGGGATNRRNYLINGNFDSWQYATSQTVTGYGSDDRWYNVNIGSTKVHSMVNATDTEIALFNASKFSRTVVTSVVGASNQVAKRQSVENVTMLAGKTVTLSFWARADSNKNIAIRLFQNFGTGGSPSVDVSSNQQLIPLITTWQKKTIVLNIPSIVGKTLGTDGVHTSSTGLKFYFEAGSSVVSAEGVTGLIQQSGTFDIAQVKLEDGSVATDGWRPYDGEFGGEVQACQRYLPVVTGGGGFAYATQSLQISATFNNARIAPTGLTVIANGIAYGSAGSPAINATIFAGAASTNSCLINIGSATAIVNAIGQAGVIANTKYLLTGCEL